MNSKIHRHSAIALLIGLAAGVPAAIADQGQQDARVYAVEDPVLGMSYGDWSAAWWQYFLPIAKQGNPFDPNVANCPGQAAGLVFFLAGAFSDKPPVSRTCTVPAGSPIMFPLNNAECSTIEPPPFQGANEAQLRACASGFGNQIDPAGLKASLDGSDISSEILRHNRVQSPVFSFSLPARIQDFVFGSIDATRLSGSKLSVSDGYWLILKPLAPGRHTLHFEGGAGLIMDYALTVQ